MLKNLLTSLIIFLSCADKRVALGADNEIRVICSEDDKKIIKKYLSQIFTDTLFNPEPEPFYYLRFSLPETFPDLKTQAQVMVCAINQQVSNNGQKLMERLLSPEQIENTLNQDPVIVGKDVYAKKQIFTIINARSEDHLMKSIKEKKALFNKIFKDQFISRQYKSLLGNYRNTNLEDSLSTVYPWTISIPWGWELIRDNEERNFVWLGKEMPFQWIGIGWREGELVNDELSIGSYIYKWPQNYYRNIQINDYQFQLDSTNYNGSKAWRARGIWETIDKKEAKGGPFQSYVFFEENLDRTYHLNYLIHHPGKDKSIYMRQMDMMVKSFKLNSK